VIIAGAMPLWRSTAPAIARVDSAGGVQATAPGTALAIAAWQGLADTASIKVDQVPARMAVEAGVDTLELDSDGAAGVTVLDSGGVAIHAPPLGVTLSDSAVITMNPDGSLHAALPGITRLVFTSGRASAAIDRVVEGTTVLVDGQRITSPTVLNGYPPFLITNGRVRVSWDSTMWQRGAVAMEVRIGTRWYFATHPRHGDWLYITSPIVTRPTQVAITEAGPGRVGLRMEYLNHWFLPQSVGYPSWIQPQPYPFARTVWLSRADNGYYSWVDILGADLNLKVAEHETGFGGLFGPATIRTNQVTLRTDTLSQTITYNGNPRQWPSGALVDAAEFIMDGDPVRRLLVPLPEAPMITPVFPGWGYGSVYRYDSPSRSFGVFLFATSVGSGPSASEVCRNAWTRAPFPLRPVSDAEFASCGPTGP
jgi:hypothetical protein